MRLRAGSYASEPAVTRLRASGHAAQGRQSWLRAGCQIDPVCSGRRRGHDAHMVTLQAMKEVMVGTVLLLQ